MSKYAVPRFVIGSKTKELIIDLARTYSVGDNVESVQLVLTRRKCGDQPNYLFNSYTVCDGKAHFKIPNEFIQADVPRGFYDAHVMIDDCEVTRIEIIKAPSRYVSGGQTVENDCTPSNWEEPPCEDNDNECNTCGGTPKNGCLSCCEEVIVMNTDEEAIEQDVEPFEPAPEEITHENEMVQVSNYGKANSSNETEYIGDE